MIRAVIITVSDSSAAGTREDTSGAELKKRCTEMGWEIAETKVLPDDLLQIQEALFGYAGRLAGIDVVLTTGGTGVSPRDRTPEATHAIADFEIPGFGELMRSEGLKKTRFAPLSRSGAFASKQTLILNLPGSPKGAVESLEAVAHLIPHAVDLLHGRTKH